ncbi:hypothetical protein PAXRUDRAFT_159993, partial [Paxillus rubicundulus Ve08.2h10]
IKAVKQLWWHPSKYNALGQILLTNQCLNKLDAALVDFEAHGMLSHPPDGTNSDSLDKFLFIYHFNHHSTLSYHSR